MYPYITPLYNSYIIWYLNSKSLTATQDASPDPVMRACVVEDDEPEDAVSEKPLATRMQ